MTVRPKVDLDRDYSFIRATENDLDELTELCTKYFTYIEPHSRRVGMTEDESQPIFKWTVAKCLHYPYTVKVVEKATGHIVGLRLASVGHKNHSLDRNPYDLDESGFSERTQKLMFVLDEAKRLFWEEVGSEVDKVLRREISFVIPEHQRRGIARRMLWQDIDIHELKSQGIRGIVSEAASLANQKLLESEGFICIAKPKYDWSHTVEEGSEGIKVLYKPF